MTERRRAPRDRRYERRAPLVAAVKQKLGAAVQLALAQNVGPTGMLLRCAPGQGFLPSTPMAMAFEIPDGAGLVRVRAQVVWQRANGTLQGIQFQDLTPPDHARILRYLDGAPTAP
jgi:hypothetical protein